LRKAWPEINIEGLSVLQESEGIPDIRIKQFQTLARRNPKNEVLYIFRKEGLSMHDITRVIAEYARSHGFTIYAAPLLPNIIGRKMEGEKFGEENATLLAMIGEDQSFGEIFNVCYYETSGLLVIHNYIGKLVIPELPKSKPKKK
jgi:hypothetical protein